MPTSKSPPIVTGLHGSNQLDELRGRDRAHHSELELGVLQLREIERLLFDGLRLLVHLRKVRQHHVAELGEMRARAFTVEQRSAEFLLE